MIQSRAASRVWPTLAAVAFIALFTGLGFWQMGRYELKQQLWRDFEASGGQSAVQVRGNDDLEAADRYAPVVLRGRYDLGHQLLLDNRVRGGRAGVAVFTPLDLASGETILVNRGWLPMDRDRRELPRAPGPKGQLSVRGLAAPPPATGIRLGEVEPPAHWPWLTPYLLTDRVEEALGRPVADKVVLLDPAARGGFLRDWEPAMLPPERHLGYAVQWFALAATVVVVWVLLTVRSRSRARMPQ